jgi:hypothetical protein
MKELMTNNTTHTLKELMTNNTTHREGTNDLPSGYVWYYWSLVPSGCVVLLVISSFRVCVVLLVISSFSVCGIIGCWQYHTHPEGINDQ